MGKYIESDVYLSGRYFIGLTNRFIKFPEHLFSYDFSLNKTIKVYTSNMQPIQMDFTVYMKIEPVYATAQLNSTFTYNLFKFYEDFGDEWQLYFKSILTNTIQSLAVNYDTSFFFENRKNFKDVLMEKINSVIRAKSNKILSIYSLLLHEIKLDQKIENAINYKLVQLQKVKLYSIADQVSVINKNTERMRRNNLADIEFVTMNAKSYYETTKIYTHSNCTDLIIKNDMSVYSELDNSIFLTLEGNMINFISVLEGREYSSKKYVNFNSLTLNEG
jgi:hypothetical protein